MIAKTEAVPIRIATFGGTSQIVTWLTPQYGKISTTIKGALRPKRIGGGQYDIGYRCELLFYERESNGLHTLKDCLALDNRKSIRGKWRETAALSYLCLLAGSNAVPAMQAQHLYKQLNTAIRAIEHYAPLPALMIWFELQILTMHGTAPQLNQCTLCSAIPQDPQLLLSARAGGLICSACNAARPHQTHAIPMQTLTLLQQIQRNPKPIPATHTNAHNILSTDDIANIGDFVQTWLDIPPHARKIAFQMATLHI